VAALVLAAGGGRRFGGAKLLAPLRGRPVLAHVLEVVQRARAAGIVTAARIVVARDDAGVADLAARAGVETVANPEPERGLASSLRLGLAAFEHDAAAALVLLADQPLVRLETLAALTAAWRDQRAVLVRPRYADAPGEPGHPVLADRSLWPLADRLAGDAGFGAVLPPGSPGVVLIDLAGGNPDVDTPADLHTLEGFSP
jgi:molybdenum cofactor cytidylyltransferase